MERNQGVKSRNVVSKPVRAGPGARAVNERWVSQIGQSMGNHVCGIEGGGKTLHGVRAHPYKGRGFNPVPQGNELVNNVGGGGPGKGRVLYGQAGSQRQYGAANAGNPRPVDKNTWPDKR